MKMSDLPAWPDDLLSGAEACDELQWLNESLTAAMARIYALAYYVEWFRDIGYRRGVLSTLELERIDALLAACERGKS